MIFTVIGHSTWPGSDSNTIYLQEDNWDDYGYKTMFRAIYQKKDLGYVKIAFKDMQIKDRIREKIPKIFSQLDRSFCSLWQSENSYVAIKQINQEKGTNIFKALNDIAYSQELFDEFYNYEVVQVSLFREVSVFQCKTQLRRIANGGAILTNYQFDIHINNNQLDLSFDIIPNTKPSTNIHALIGRNGIGKTRLIRDIAESICKYDDENTMTYRDNKDSSTFANVLCVSFSPFDDYSKIIEIANNPISGLPKCTYIGLDRNNKDLLGNIEKMFLNDLSGCLSSKNKSQRWLKMIEILNNDPMFLSIHIEALASKGLKQDGTAEGSAIERAKRLFSLLSSGHKCVLSILTSCVNKLEEKSLVMIDEPENHLHPPLLSSLIQALSFLLNDRNGVAIISTHSPVVLQEIPKSCVWILNRFGDEWSGKRPEFETYGADIGSLTREVFGLEVLMSGYHKMIKETVDKAICIEDVFDSFNYNIGNEAAGLVHVLWNEKKKEPSGND